MRRDCSVLLRLILPPKPVTSTPPMLQGWGEVSRESARAVGVWWVDGED